MKARTKTKVLILVLMIWTVAGFAQETAKDTAKLRYQNTINEAVFSDKNIPAYFISLDRTTTIISPEPILFVDISTSKVEGDLSEATGNKVVRLKPTNEFAENESFTVSIVTEKMVALYKLTGKSALSQNDNVYTIAINPANTWRLNAYSKLSGQDFERLAFHAFTRKRKIYNISTKQSGVEGWVNNIYTVGEYIILDIGIKNHTRIPFSIDELRFSILDKYAVSAHVSQELEIQPKYRLYDAAHISVAKTWRNFYVFPKLTYPDNKVLQIAINEKPISGRKLSISIDYNQLLQADTLD